MDPLPFGTSSVLAWLFDSTVHISILICLILIMRAVNRKKLPVWWGYGLWLLLIVRMLLPWGFENPLNVFNYVPAPPMNDPYMPFLMEHKLSIPFPARNEYSSVMDEAKDSAAAAVNKHKNGKPGTNKFHLSLGKALLIVWISGLVFFCIFTLYKNLRFWTGIRNGRKIEDEHTRSLLANCMSLLSIRRNVSVIATDKVKSPAIFGYFKPSVVRHTDEPLSKVMRARLTFSKTSDAFAVQI